MHTCQGARGLLTGLGKRGLGRCEQASPFEVLPPSGAFLSGSAVPFQAGILCCNTPGGLLMPPAPCPRLSL